MTDMLMPDCLEMPSSQKKCAGVENQLVKKQAEWLALPIL